MITRRTPSAAAVAGRCLFELRVKLSNQKTLCQNISVLITYSNAFWFGGFIGLNIDCLMSLVA